MIYTSYFAKLKKLPENIVPIAICAKVPDWYKGLQYKKLAPKYEFFSKWKQDHDNDEFVKCYKEQILDKLNAHDTVIELSEVAGFINRHNDICLICYEKSSDFCHRHLVADWLNENGYKCRELNENII